MHIRPVPVCHLSVSDIQPQIFFLVRYSTTYTMNQESAVLSISQPLSWNLPSVLTILFMEWSPQAAMKAYLHTLDLYQANEKNTSYGSTDIMEPKCMEFISALAAGKQAKLMVEVSTEGITPFTIALAAAAKQTGGRLICILAHHQDLKRGKTQLLKDDDNHQDLADVIEFVCGNPFQVAMEYKNIDFLVIDGKLRGHLKLVKSFNVNPRRSVIVGHNLQYSKNGVSFGQLLNGKGGVGVVTLPIGEGIELTRIEPINKWKSKRRFHVTFEN
ncbi:uncharacterized protein LOC8277167 isoform X2 [Ricinus communis]|uniref:uncharacterized protein LOC8277167 isoform X2 n=1 Tax=Ricinus communis TaxID=3988 RepID=UPI0007722551|nr:uncharacterized protein LOC8277167 isoform X2 [Ricinus communis]|eukprot:XP_015578715.1 uncharacterized protein LOC8277167 isoform X2 [Ricinus communis]